MAMKPSEIFHLVRVARPPAPYGARRLARCVTIEDVARVARRRLPLGARSYLENGGEGQHTLRRDRAAFRDVRFQPRQPCDVSDVDTSTTVLGRRIPLPFALSPVGAPRLMHYEGELAVARAARHAGIPYGISTLGNTSVEDVAAQTDTPLWFQMYVWGDRSRIKQAVARAKAAGFEALLLNIDTAVRSERVPEKHAGLTLPRPELSLTTLLEGALHPAWVWRFLTSPTVSFPNIGPPDLRSLEVMPDMFDGTVVWEDLDWIRRMWDGPIVLKGVTTVGQAAQAVDHGLDAVIVSNHGGRQLDHLPATIEVLPRIVDAVGDRAEVLVDSGFRRGTDITAALALGAKAVLLGRAHLYGLAAAGEAGVRHCIDILARELRMTMQLCGARSIADLDRGLVYQPPESGAAAVHR